MALSRQALNDYDATLSRVERAAADYVRRRVDAYMASYPDASVADVRDFAIGVIDDAVGAYGDAASTAAADLYDELAEASPKTLPTATVDTSDVSAYVDREVRYQAGRLADGASTEFVRQVAMCASDQVSRRANATMMRNVERDHVRYARVPMGGETCTFCAMLASRGFAYKSAKAAGEGAHWHRNCRCKVVPETAGVVDGYDPDEWYGRWQAMEELDDNSILTEKARSAAKVSITGLNVDPTSFNRLTAQAEADSYTQIIDKAHAEFSKSKTLENYERTIGAFLRKVGEAKGITVTGEYGAKPDGDEIVDATALAKSSVMFRRERQDQHNPDVLLDGLIVEIKTPKSRRKVTKRLLHAAVQFDAYPSEPKICLLSLLRLPAGFDPTGVARRFVQDGTLDEIYVVDPSMPTGKTVIADLKRK